VPVLPTPARIPTVRRGGGPPVGPRSVRSDRRTSMHLVRPVGPGGGHGYRADAEGQKSIVFVGFSGHHHGNDPGGHPKGTQMDNQPRPDTSDMRIVHDVFCTSYRSAPDLIRNADGDAARRELVLGYLDNVLALLLVHRNAEEELLFPPAPGAGPRRTRGPRPVVRPAPGGGDPAHRRPGGGGGLAGRRRSGVDWGGGGTDGAGRGGASPPR